MSTLMILHARADLIFQRSGTVRENSSYCASVQAITLNAGAVVPAAVKERISPAADRAT
jgi:hypothetical protein